MDQTRMTAMLGAHLDDEPPQFTDKYDLDLEYSLGEDPLDDHCE